MNELACRIAEEIGRGGIISFSRFMERALYEPELGYYEKRASTPGRSGDFYTSVSVGPLFGRLLAFKFCSWLKNLTAHRPVLIECGAQTGQLARDMIHYLSSEHPALWDRLEYWILEPSRRRQSWQRSTLGKFEAKVKWVSDWHEIPEGAIEGIIFSNELLDAFPCQCFFWSQAARDWIERGVGCHNDQFIWAERPLDHCLEKPSCPIDLLPFLPDRFLTETSRAATTWWSEAALRLGRGRLMTVDYGLSNDEFFSPGRAQGTLRAFRHHRTALNILSDPGNQDLTSHVNLSALTEAGERAGLRTEPRVSQEKFLNEIAASWLECDAEVISDPADRRQFQTLTHPQHLGSLFQVFIQARE